ncbi:MAG: Gfo/Idh/MocA family oxidoreductase [Lachnospiraceae bacterium]|nr:Gfo/Idh/MocA family oxidoreductase [Lachnospiraceae bacterium]
MKEYRWASLGCGVIANQLAEAMEKQGRKLYGIANRTHEKAVAFAKKYGVEKVYNKIEDVFEDENVDIIYISTPHNTHINYLRKALAAGKHVLCEKSITLNSEELDEAIALAKENNVILAEAMTIYHMPIYKELARLKKSGKLGELKLIQMNFGSYKEYDMNNRFFNRSLAGGAMLDIGVYALSFVRWFMTSIPDQVLSQVKYAPTGVDEQASLLLKNKEEEMATVILSLHAKQPKRGMIAFNKAYVELYEYPRGEKAVITYTEDGRQEVIETGATEDALVYEIRDMEAAVSAMEELDMEKIEEYIHLTFTKDVMDLMTGIRKEWGMKYPEEE